MICDWCEEPITDGDKFIRSAEEDGQRRRPFHMECIMRLIIGNAAHQMRECACFGGARGDEPNLTKRQQARLALDTFRTLSGHPIQIGETIQ